MDNSLESRVCKLEAEIAALQARNHSVELAKAWETSLTRRAWLLLLIYLLACLMLWLAGDSRFYLNALIPTLAFYFSTLSLPLVRTAWEKRSR